MDVIPSRDWHFVTIFMICLSKLYCKKKALKLNLTTFLQYTPAVRESTVRESAVRESV